MYQYDAGPTAGGWDRDRTKFEALVPITNGDFAVAVRLQGFAVQHLFE